MRTKDKKEMLKVSRIRKRVSKEGEDNDFQFPVNKNGNRVATRLTEVSAEKARELLAERTRKKFGVKEKFVK